MRTALLLASASLIGAPIPEKWTEALALVESGDNHLAYGDGTSARGPHQFHRAAWADVTKMRKAQGKTTWTYTKARTRYASYAYAETWLTFLRDQIKQMTGREPTAQQVFLAHNMGLEGFRAIGFDPHRAPHERFDAANRFATLAK